MENFRKKKCFSRPTKQSYHEQLEPLVMRLYVEQIVMIGQETTTVQATGSRRKIEPIKREKASPSRRPAFKTRKTVRLTPAL